MERTVKSFSELQRQFIGAELGRREAAGRKAVTDAQLHSLDESLAAPAVVKVVEADR